MKDLKIFMGSPMSARQIWLDWYPVQENLITGLSTEDDAVSLLISGADGLRSYCFLQKVSQQGTVDTTRSTQRDQRYGP